MRMSHKIKAQFPLLQQTMRGKPLVYLDSAATTQKPQLVLDAMNHYYTHDNANVHRGVYEISERATLTYEAVRDKVQRFIHAASRNEIIFTRGTTDSINLVAFSFGQQFVSAGDEIVVSAMEHHSNIVPWQMLCERKGATLKVIPVKDDGTLDQQAYDKLLTNRVKLVALVHISNALGTMNPIKNMIAKAHAKNIAVLIDGAQAVGHHAVDVQDLDCDFYCFSSHKMYGPTGSGILYGKEKWLTRMPPYQGGGDMIAKVTFEKTDYNVLPFKFEAGTPSIAEVIGLGAAIDFLMQFDKAAMVSYEKKLVDYLAQQLKTVSGLRIIGDNSQRSGAVSFVMQSAHAHDVATILDNEGVAIRAGHHCAMPLMQRYAVPATARASIALYNDESDIDELIDGLHKVNKLFG